MSKFSLRFDRVSVLVLFTVALFATNKSSLAADIFWVGGTGVWDDGNNWSLTQGGVPGAGVPGVADDARLLQSGTTNNVVTYQGTNPAVGFLPIDATGTGMITLSQSQGDLVADDIQVGRDGQALFDQSGGTLNVSNLLLLGRNTGSQGQYNFSGGTIDTIGKFIGRGGAGVFNHTGGTSNVSVTFQVATQATGTGTYKLSGTGNLTTSESFIGAFGHGTFVQSDGTHAIDTTSGGTGSLSLGFDGGSRGFYEMSGGTLQVASNEYIGVVGQGTFTQTGGTHTVGQDLYLSYADQFGQDADRRGVFNLAGGSLDVGDDEFIGMDGIGIFNHTSGSNTVADRLVLGKLTQAAVAGTATDVIGTGVYNLGGGNLSSLTTEVGEFGIGTLNQTGGTNTVAGELLIGKEASGVGTYNLISGGLSANSIAVGQFGVGTFNQTGGANTTDSMSIAGVSGSSGTYNLKAGSLTVAGTITNTGTFNFSGGELTADQIVNDGTLVVSGGGIRLLNGNVTNNTILKTQTGTTPVFGGVFNNNGLLVNDPIFLADAIVGQDGVFIEDVGGDDYIFGRDFINESRKNVQWNTIGSVMSFLNSIDLGSSGTFATQIDHELFLPGADLGADAAGFIDNFAWDTLLLGSGNQLELMDGNIDILAGALYVNILTLEDGISQIDSIIGNGLNIYYRPGLAQNAYLGGQTFDLSGGGQIKPIPLPASFYLLVSTLVPMMGRTFALRGNGDPRRIAPRLYCVSNA